MLLPYPYDWSIQAKDSKKAKRGGMLKKLLRTTSRKAVSPIVFPTKM